MSFLLFKPMPVRMFRNVLGRFFGTSGTRPDPPEEEEEPSDSEEEEEEDDLDGVD